MSCRGCEEGLSNQLAHIDGCMKPIDIVEDDMEIIKVSESFYYDGYNYEGWIDVECKKNTDYNIAYVQAMKITNNGNNWDKYSKCRLLKVGIVYIKGQIEKIKEQEFREARTQTWKIICDHC